MYKEAIERLKKENFKLKEQLDSRERKLKEREVFIMNLMEEFNKKMEMQRKSYEVTIQDLQEKILIKQKHIGMFK